jgi:hypothetical protein
VRTLGRCKRGILCRGNRRLGCLRRATTADESQNPTKVEAIEVVGPHHSEQQAKRTVCERRGEPGKSCAEYLSYEIQPFRIMFDRADDQTWVAWHGMACQSSLTTYTKHGHSPITMIAAKIPMAAKNCVCDTPCSVSTGIIRKLCERLRCNSNVVRERAGEEWKVWPGVEVEMNTCFKGKTRQFLLVHCLRLRVGCAAD